ncbi:MAG: VOC family protein [Nitrospirota bacterium]|nr:VOC family protein [Nitrospirota bacterium]
MDHAVELDGLIERMIEKYVSSNRAAKVLRALLEEAGVGFYPVADHLTLRTLDIDRRAEEFTRLGYGYSETIEYEDWYAKVYRKVGYPALFVDQAYSDERGRTSIIPAWVNTFGDQVFHHVAVRVEDIELAMERLKAKGVAFTGQIVGARGGQLRQIFTVPEVVDGQPFSVLELAERHRGYQGFSPPQADSLMKSTLVR